MSLDRRSGRLSREGEQAARWDALKAWPEKIPTLKEVRLEAIADTSAVLIRNGLRRLISQEGVILFRLGLYDEEVEKRNQEGDAAAKRSSGRRMESNEYRTQHFVLENMVDQLIEGEIATNMDIKRGNHPSTVHQAELIVGLRIAGILDDQTETGN